MARKRQLRSLRGERQSCTTEVRTMGASHAIQQQLVETRHDTHAHATLASIGGMGLHDRSKHHVCKLLSGHYDLFRAVRLSLVRRGIY